MTQNNLEQIKNLEAECEKIKEDINRINCQREAQDDAFERKLGRKQKELSKIQQTIDAFNISMLETAFPTYFKTNDSNENFVAIYKTKNIFRDKKFVVVVDKLLFCRYGEANTEFTIYRKSESWNFNNPGEVLNYINNDIQKLTEEEYNECKKKIFEMALNI